MLSSSGCVGRGSAVGQGPGTGPGRGGTALTARPLPAPAGTQSSDELPAAKLLTPILGVRLLLGCKLFVNCEVGLFSWREVQLVSWSDGRGFGVGQLVRRGGKTEQPASEGGREH